MILNQEFGFPDEMLCQSGLRREFHVRTQPELGFSIRVGNMNVQPRLLTGEEKEAKRSIPEDCGRHANTPAW
jgi:hypothetical protein